MGPDWFSAEAGLRAAAATLTLGAAAAGSTAWGAASVIRSGSGRKLVWQAATAAIALLVLVELTGARFPVALRPETPTVEVGPSRAAVPAGVAVALPTLPETGTIASAPSL